MESENRHFVWDIFRNLVRHLVSSVNIIREAAVNAADDWADANQASYNAALPEPFATWATPRQKAALLAWVIQASWCPMRIDEG